MASPQHRRATVCLTCGDKGETELLIYCRNCRDSAVHHYCMKNFTLGDDDIKWWCWDCRGEDIIKAEPSRKSERLCIKRERAQDMRTYWKQKLVPISKDIHKTGRVVRGPEINLENERPRDLDILDNEKSIPETVISSGHNESIRTDEPMVTANSNLPVKQEHHMKSFDEIPEFGNNKDNLLFKDGNNAKSDGKDIGLQVSLPVVNGFPSTPDTLCRQPYLEHDDSLAAEPITAPVWRGRFNIKEESVCVEILAHISNKACWKVSDAAVAMPPMLDIKLLEKYTIWPKHFRAAPPTAASIGLYFFPACERDERIYDSLLHEVVDRDLALKVVFHDLELLIFPSPELPLNHWRINRKYFLWGVFKKMQRSYSSTESASTTQLLGHSKPTAIGDEEGFGWFSITKPSQSSLSEPHKPEKQNVLSPSMENTQSIPHV